MRTSMILNRPCPGFPAMRTFLVLVVSCLLAGAAIVPAAAVPPDGQPSVTVDRLPDVVHKIGDQIVLSGTNTASDTTYLCLFTYEWSFVPGKIYGPTDAEYRQIQSADPETNPVVSGDASTLQAVRVRPDHTWTWTWDTRNIRTPAIYSVLAFSSPDVNGQHQSGNYEITSRLLQNPENFAAAPSRFYQIDARLLVDYTVGGGICSGSPDSGSQVVVEWETDAGKGTNRGCLAGTTLSNPKYIRVHAYEVRGNYPVSVSIVQAPSTSREKTVLSASDPGGKKPIDLSYDVPAVSSDTKTASGTENPVSGLTIAPQTARRGDRVFINGTITGNTDYGIAVWILAEQEGDVPLFGKRLEVKPDASGRFSAVLKSTDTGTMPEGLVYVIAQHPGKNHKFDVVLDGNQVFNLRRPDYYDPSLNLQVLRINQVDRSQGRIYSPGSGAEYSAVSLSDAIGDVNGDDSAVQGAFYLKGTTPVTSDPEPTPAAATLAPLAQPAAATKSALNSSAKPAMTAWPASPAQQSPACPAGALAAVLLAGFSLRLRRSPKPGNGNS